METAVIVVPGYKPIIVVLLEEISRQAVFYHEMKDFQDYWRKNYPHRVDNYQIQACWAVILELFEPVARQYDRKNEKDDFVSKNFRRKK